jgi:hypothetical protein
MCSLVHRVRLPTFRRKSIARTEFGDHRVALCLSGHEHDVLVEQDDRHVDRRRQHVRRLHLLFRDLGQNLDGAHHREVRRLSLHA